MVFSFIAISCFETLESKKIDKTIESDDKNNECPVIMLTTTSDENIKQFGSFRELFKQRVVLTHQLILASGKTFERQIHSSKIDEPTRL